MLRRPRNLIALLALAVILVVVVAAAIAIPPRLIVPGMAPRLRIHNTGTVDLDQLVVRFPNEPVAFGTVSAGTTSPYQPVPHGVYGYAAYEWMLNGRPIRQGVSDWIGEHPLAGNTFTYVLQVDPAQPEWSMIQSEVRVDE